MPSSRECASSHWSPYSGSSYLKYSKYSSRKAKRNDFLFMTEFGMVLKSKKYGHKTAKGLLKELNHRLQKGKFPTKVGKPGNPGDWTLIHDKSILVEKNNQHAFGVAIISPAYDLKDFKKWMPDFRDMFRVLHKFFVISGWFADCGTHVYLIPARGGWHVEQIKRLAVSALYYEHCFDSLVGDVRKRPTFAKSNRYNGYFSHKRFKTTKHVVRKLRKQGRITDIGKRMCWVGKNTATGKALKHSNSRMFPHWSFEWNFTWLKNNGLGIVEFQQLPISDNVQYGVGWTLLTLLFARTAMANGSKFKAKGNPVDKDLKKVIEKEAKKVKVPKKGREFLKHIFNHPHTVAAHPEYAKVLNPGKISKDQGHQLQWRDKHGRTALKKYLTWLKKTQSKSRLSRISKLNSSYFSASKSSSKSKSKSKGKSKNGGDSDSDSYSMSSSSESKSKSKSGSTSYWDSSLSDTKSSYSTTKSDDDDTITVKSFKSYKTYSTRSGRRYSTRKSYRSISPLSSSRSRSRSKSKSNSKRSSSKKSKSKKQNLDDNYEFHHEVPAALVNDVYGHTEKKKEKEKSSNSTISGDSDTLSSLSRTKSWVFSTSSASGSSE